MLPNDTFDLIVDKGTFDSVLCSTMETGGDGDGTTTTSEAVSQAAGEAIERAKAHPDPRQAPPFHSFGKHVRNIWRTLKQGGVYLVVTTGAPSTRISKIKKVGHGLKSKMDMWQRVSHVKLERLGARVLNTSMEEDKHHWAYIFVKTARRDVLKVGGSTTTTAAAAAAPAAMEIVSPLLLPEEEEEESSDDSSEGDLVDSEEDSEGEEEEIVSDVEES